MSVQVSKWTKFFANAGIPSGPAQNYAVIFYDHRIQEDMLPDLTKEILRDIGITVMGDIIAILRHGKEVYAQSEREKSAKDMAVIDSSESPSPGNQTPIGVKRKSTAASRMVDHWINNQKSGTSSPVRDPQPSPSSSPSPAPPRKNLKIEAAISQEKPQATGAQKTLSERFGGHAVKVHVTNKPKTAAVTPPKVTDEHTLKVKLPQGSTERSKKLLAKQKQAVASAAVNKAKVIKRQSVFDRLGKESPPLEVAVKKPEKKTEVKALKPLKTSITVQLKDKSQGSVFSRLGGLASSPAAATSTVQAVNPRIRLPSSDDEPEDIDYTSHSVLKPVKRKGVPAKPVKPVKPVKRSTGLNSDVDAGKSVFARLGSKV